MTFEPQDIEAVRAYWASYQKLEQEGLVVGTALEDNREALALGQAWARCEAALPEGWEMAVVSDNLGTYSAAAYNAANVMQVDVHRCPTPTAALLALAEKLESLP